MVDTLIDNITEFIINPVIVLLFVVALAVFFWGVFEFIRDSASDIGREKGKQHLIWGVIGMFIMVVAYAIIGVLANTFGFKNPF